MAPTVQATTGAAPPTETAIDPKFTRPAGSHSGMSAFDEIGRRPPSRPAVLQLNESDVHEGPLKSLIFDAEMLTNVLAFGTPDGELRSQFEDAAFTWLESMQEWLDALDPASPLRRTVIYVMIRLAAASLKLPRSLYVRDIDLGPVRDPAVMGGHADIFTAQYRSRVVALKRLRSFNMRESDFHKGLCREALVWRQLTHPFILPFIGIDDTTFASTGFLCLVSPWMRRGTLKHFMNSPDYVPTRDLLRLLGEAAQGLEYLHTQKVVHGDVKDLNVLIDDGCHAQLCDFGLAVVGDATQGRMTTTARGVGSGVWQSPERLLGERHRRTVADDVYAVGCLAYYMLTRHAPFHELNEMGAAMKIVNGDRPSRPTTSLSSDALWSLITSCWAHDPKARPSMRIIVSRLCMSPGFDVQIRKLQPRRTSPRGGASDALALAGDRLEWVGSAQDASDDFAAHCTLFRTEPPPIQQGPPIQQADPLTLAAAHDGASAKRRRTDGASTEPKRIDSTSAKRRRAERSSNKIKTGTPASASPLVLAAKAGPSKPTAQLVSEPTQKFPATTSSETAAAAPTPLDAASSAATAAVQSHLKRDSWAIHRCDGHTAEVFFCTWNPTKPDIFASGDKMAGVNIWSLPPTLLNENGVSAVPESLVPVHMRTVSTSEMPDTTALDWSADGALLSVATYDNVLHVLTANGGEYMAHDMHKGPIFATRFSHNCQWLLTVSLDGTACVWDVPGNRLKMFYKCHLDCCLDCDWLDDDIFATCGADKFVHLLRVGDQKPLKTLRGHTNEINQVRFHAQQQLLATCSDDRTARIWRLQDILARARGGVAEPDGAGADSETDPSIVLRGHKNNVSTVDWCPAQPGGAVLLVTTSFDGTTRLWDSETGACQRTFADHKTPVFAVKLSPDGRWLATGGGDGLLFVYDIAKREKRWAWNADEFDDADERAQPRTRGIFEIDWQQVNGRNRMVASLESKHVAIIDVAHVPELNP